MAAAAAKAMISMSRARAAASARSATTVPRRLHSTVGEGTLLSDTKEKIHHEEHEKYNIEAALSDHTLDLKKLLHEQDLKIRKLQNELDISKIELEAMNNKIKVEVMNGQTQILKYAMVILGVGAFSTLVFK